MKMSYLLALGAAALGLSTGSAVAQAKPKVAANAAAGNNHRLDATFEQIDKNKDGYLDAEELAKYYRGPSAKVIEDKLDAKEVHPEHTFMDAWDADKDNKISKAEFEKYEAKVIADAKLAANKKTNYSTTSRSNYRAPQRHRNYNASGYRSNPYQNFARSQQRAYMQQRQAFSNMQRYGFYSPNVRGGYRGTIRHPHVGRRR